MIELYRLRGRRSGPVVRIDVPGHKRVMGHKRVIER